MLGFGRSPITIKQNLPSSKDADMFTNYQQQQHPLIWLVKKLKVES
jgi:hypothetical protein